MKRLGFAIITLLLSISCGGSSKKKSPIAAGSSSASKVDFSTQDTLQFYAASGIGVSAIRYVLKPTSLTVQKYVPGSGSALEVEKTVTLTAAQLSALTTPLGKLSKTTWPTCTTCNSSERTVWVEGDNEIYYYGTLSNCTCTGVTDKPQLTYSEIEAIYQAILAYFP